jgi:phosphatidylglycerophosphatase A
VNAAGRPLVARPTLAFMRPRLSRWIAFGAGSGLSPVSPGTVGTLWAWVAFLLLDPWLGEVGWAVVLPLAFLIGVWACERTGQDLGVHDHGAMVWDEVVAFWCVLWLVPSGLGMQALAFVLFRVFDIAKPPPIRRLEHQVPGGWGVMVDDLMAAAYTLLVMALWVRCIGG